MKRLFLSVAVLATVASCSKSEVVEKFDTPNAINFETLYGRVTRSANDAGSDWEVYAVKNISGADDTKWYIDAGVYSSDKDDDPDITTNDVSAVKYYWPTDGASLDFYAFAPAGSANLGSSDFAVGTRTLTYTVPADAQEDFTVATPQINQTSSDVEPTVTMPFNHILAKVTVQVKFSSNLDAYACSWNGAAYDKTNALAAGDATIGVYDNKTSIAMFDTNADPHPNYYTSTPVVTTRPTPAEPTVKYDVANQNVYYVMPQPMKDCTIAVDGIKITSGEGVVVYDDSDATNYKLLSDNTLKETDGSFEAGKHYVITITVDNDATDTDEDPIIGSEITIVSNDRGWTDSSVSFDQN